MYPEFVPVSRHLQQRLEVLGVQALLPRGIERIILRHEDGGEQLAIGKSLVSDMPHPGGNIYGRQIHAGDKGIVTDDLHGVRKLKLEQLNTVAE